LPVDLFINGTHPTPEEVGQGNSAVRKKEVKIFIEVENVSQGSRHFDLFER
jgi:NADH:ubiquinone oxidoreductase subunit B-like Fe-S oxidoreductase